LQLLYLKNEGFSRAAFELCERASTREARSLENAGDEIGGKAHELLLLLVGGSCGGRRAARRQLRGSCHSWGRARPGKRQSAHIFQLFRATMRVPISTSGRILIRFLRIRIFNTYGTKTMLNGEELKLNR
jgi:hypothetical protein